MLTKDQIVKPSEEISIEAITIQGKRYFTFDDLKEHYLPVEQKFLTILKQDRSQSSPIVFDNISIEFFIYDNE